MRSVPRSRLDADRADETVGGDRCSSVRAVVIGRERALIRDLYSRAAAPSSEDDTVKPRHARHLVLPASDERGERFALVVSFDAIQRFEPQDAI